MSFYQNHKRITILLLVFAALVIFVAFELLFVKFNGKSVPVPVTPRESVEFGAGDPLTYVLMGDSTAAGQGADYDKGIAMGTAHHLAGKYKVTFTNLGVSDARTSDVRTKQLAQAIALKPNIVLIAVGANDVTHLIPKGFIQRDLQETINQLLGANCETKIVITGAAAMGSVPRFPQPLRWIAGTETKRLNTEFVAVAKQNNLTFAALAEKTGPIFAKDFSLFAPDKFHPNAAGYGVWTTVLNDALDDALKNQPSHCKA